jgi:hypothetical protein
MKNQLSTLLLLSLVVCNGCSSFEFAFPASTTRASRAQAESLAAKVAIYRQEQSDRVDRLNASFNEIYRQLTHALDTITADQLLADRDDAAQRIADSLISKPDNSLRQAVRDTFRQTEQNDQKALSDADLALAAALVSYQQAHTSLSVPLDKLRKAEQNLRALAQIDKTETEKNAVNVIQKVFTAFQALSKSTQEQKNPLTPKTTSTNSVGNRSTS